MAWYLLFCKKQEQLRAKMHLENQGVECYFPILDVEKMVRGKIKRVSEPLFPCYVFINFDPNVGPSFTTIRSTRGVVDFVRCGVLPQTVNDSLINELKTNDKLESWFSDTPNKNDALPVVQEYSSGLDAIYQEQDGANRSFLLINILNNQ